MYRNKKIRDGARDEPCVNCGSVGTTVAAHSNLLRHGKGVGLKSHDCYVCYFCHNCHDLYDKRKGNLTREEREEMFMTGWEKTILVIVLKGILK